jgi:sulfoxide reductase heme-binding subunit YedZ
VPTVKQIRRVGKPLVFVAASLPLLWLAAGAFGFGGADLGADPIETLQDELGIWGLRLLLLTLAVTPFQRLIGQAWPLQFRRMLGLFAFTYCALHFLNYLVLDQGLYLPEIIEDVTQRLFITVGFAALLLLLPLAVTSTAGWRRRLGKRWNRLHQLIYPLAILACWHFWWQAKKDITEPAIYAAILATLLGARLWHQRRRLQARAAAAQSGS